MSSHKLEKFAKMANQISDAHSALPPDEAAAGAASHIRKFWTPKMIGETLAALERQQISVNETSVRAFAILKREFAGAD